MATSEEPGLEFTTVHDRFFLAAFTIEQRYVKRPFDLGLPSF
ncbi:MAG: hypothetical protein ACOCSF_03010 [Halanaeroarchaeum sp.]